MGISARTSGVLRASLAGALFVSLAGCSGGTRQALGLVRSSPDEFMVVAKAPLVLPPDFGLRPPIPGAPPLAVAEDPVARANAALTPRAAAPAGVAAAPAQAQRANLTAGENALLGAAGTTVAEPGIRDRIDLEAQQLANRDRTFVERLLWWQNPELDQRLKPAEEADRLRAQGTPTTGMPTARRMGGGLF